MAGYLLGSAAGDAVHISDALPLVHSHPSGRMYNESLLTLNIFFSLTFFLFPHFKLAFTGPIFQIGEELVSGGNQIVGYYFCNEVASQSSPPDDIEAVVASRSSTPLVVLKLDLNLLLSKNSICFQALDYNKEIETIINTVSGDTFEGMSEIVSKCLSQNDQEKLFDVDELLTSAVNIAHLKSSNAEITKKLQNLSK